MQMHQEFMEVEDIVRMFGSSKKKEVGFSSTPVTNCVLQGDIFIPDDELELVSGEDGLRLSVGTAYPPFFSWDKETNIFDYLVILSKLSGDEFEKETKSPIFKIMTPQIKHALLKGEDRIVNTRLSDRLVEVGVSSYIVAGGGALHLDFAAGRLAWKIKQ